MKRLLMITSAIGLCLGAPAFAQTTPTEQEQLNKQQAAPPSTSAPAAQSQDRQRQDQQRSNQGGQAQQQPASGSSSSSAQAPASQDQKDQAQKQPSGGSSPSSAQAPASQDKKGQAQNQRKPADSSTNAQLPADQKPSATDRKQRAQSDKQNRQSQQKMQQQDAQSSSSTDRSASAKANINDDQRTRIAAAISSTNVRSVSVNFRIATGVVVPRTVVLHTLPTNIVSIAPQFRGYRYFVANDEIVIVEPRRKTIVTTLPAGGTARAQAPAAKRISFSDEQREVIRKRASTLRSSATTGASSSRILVEQEVPATIELQEFPAEIVTEVPLVRSYRFFRQDNDVFVVDPTERRVIEIIR